MKLPRDIAGDELAKRLRPVGYEVTRQTGSHMRLTSTTQGRRHHVTIPKHRTLRVGTLNTIISSVADHLEVPRKDLIEQLFG